MTKKEYVAGRLKDIVDSIRKAKPDGIGEEVIVKLKKADVKAIDDAAKILSETKVDPDVADWINEVVSRFYDQEITAKMMAMMISYALNAERMWN